MTALNADDFYSFCLLSLWVGTGTVDIFKPCIKAPYELVCY